MPTTPKMFSLKFKALRDGKLSESLSFKDTWTTNISYDFVVLDAEIPVIYHCLLYTSDAADERSSVDLGGRRIIKKNT